MILSGPGTITVKRTFALLLSVLLLFSFFLHSVQVKHDHYAASIEHAPHSHDEKKSLGVNLEAVMHHADKKLLLFVVVSLVAAVFLSVKGVFSRLCYFANQTTYVCCRKWGSVFRIHDFLSIYFRRGIFHTKAY